MADLQTVTPTIRWRSVLSLQIQDATLRGHVERALDQFERSSFTYPYLDPATGQMSERRISGQDILGRIQGILQSPVYTSSQMNAIFMENLAQIGIRHVNGRFVIADHDRTFSTTDIQTQAMTAFAGAPPRSLPMAILIGQDYLRRGEQLGTDGRWHPVSVDGVIAHELAHLAFLNPGERPIRTPDGQILPSPLQIEIGYSTALRGPARAPTSVRIGPDHGYHTLYQNAPTHRGSLELGTGETDHASLSLPRYLQNPRQLASALHHGPTAAV